MSSERITWELCPRCGRTAAVGWLAEVPVEFACTVGCAPTELVLRRFRRIGGNPPPPRPWAAIRGGRVEDDRAAGGVVVDLFGRRRSRVHSHGHTDDDR